MEYSELPEELSKSIINTISCREYQIRQLAQILCVRPVAEASIQPLTLRYLVKPALTLSPRHSRRPSNRQDFNNQQRLECFQLSIGHHPLSRMHHYKTPPRASHRSRKRNTGEAPQWKQHTGNRRQM